MNPFAALDANFSQERLNQFMKQQQQKMKSMPQTALNQTASTGASMGGLGGLVRSSIQGIAEPFSYLLNSSIVNPTKELSARVSGNNLALKNARKESNRELGLGEDGKDIVGATKKWAGNSAQALLAAKVPNPASFKGAAALGAANSGAMTLADRDSDLLDVLTSGVIGAGTGAGFKGVGKLANKGTTKLGGVMDSQADKYAGKQLGLQGNFIGKFKDKLKEDPGSVIRRYSIGSLEDVDDNIAQQNQLFGQMIKEVGDVDKATVLKKIQQEAQELLSAGPGPLKRRGELLMQEATQLLQDYDDKIPGDVLNMVKSHYDGLSNWGLAQKDPDMFEVTDIMANALRETIQETSGNPKLKLTGKELQKLKEIRKEAVARQATVQSRGSSPLNARSLLGAVIGGGAAGIPGALGLGAATAFANSAPGRRAIAGGVQAGTKFLQKDGSTMGGALLNRAVPGAANYMAGSATPTATAQGMNLEDAATQDFMNQSMPSQSQTNTMTTDTGMMNNANPMSSNMSGLYPITQQMSTGGGSPYSRENLLADIQRDPNNAMDYIEYYQTLDDIFNPASQSNLARMTQMQKLTSTDTQPLSQGQQQRADLVKAIDLTDSAINQGSINFGPIGSRVESAKSIFNMGDPETTNFKSVVGGLRGAIAIARAGSSMSDGERQLLDQYTPNFTDSEQQLRAKISGLKSIYGGSQPIGGNSIEDMLLMQQGAMY